MCDQEVQSDAFVAETSNVYCAVVEGVHVEGGLPPLLLAFNVNVIFNKLLCSIELGSIICNLETAKIRRKAWQLLSRHCQNWNSHSPKIGYLLPVCHRNNS